MKNKSILSLIIFLLGFGVSTTSCEDMLTPDMERTAGGFRGNDTVYFYLGIMANLQEMIENNVILGEIRGDLAETTSYTSDSVSKIANFEKVPDGDNGLLNRAAYYKVINQCNFYLANVDTMVMKNNIYYMRKECAQVYAIRAWTYMQLVQNYGSVPFITKPVDNANTGWEKNPEAWATADNLVDLLRADLEKAHAYEERYGFPNYGNLYTGAVNVPHRLLVFPSQVVLGDLYLLRGKDKSDYEKAATQYFEYLSDDNRQVMGLSAGYSSHMVNGVYHYTPSASTYTRYVVESTSPSLELQTVLPSAANSFFGKVLTRVPQMYGFDISSSSSTSTSEDDNGETNASTSGRISVQPNYKTRQIAPAFGYLNLCADQLFVKYKDFMTDEDSGLEYIDMGDARIAGTVADVRTQDAGIVKFIQKFASNGGSSFSASSLSSFGFRYTLPIYRLRQIYLRYAEALNRAGFPQHAFAILRNGLNEDKLPSLVLGVRYDDSDPEHPKAYQYYYTETEPDGCFYISADELRRAQDHPEFMNYAIGNGWQENYGIKEAGSSSIISTDLETRYVYGPVVAKRVEQEALRRGFSEEEAKELAAAVWTETVDEPSAGEDEGNDEGEGEEGEGEGDDTPEINPDDYETVEPEAPKEVNPWEVIAMETLLADEMALECAYEGFRFYDLMRIARHKNNDSTTPADEGTTWLAWLVSRRSLDLKPYAEPAQVGPLYTKLLDMNNWYLQNPVY